MAILAQALGEYGGLAARARTPALDAFLDRLSRGEPTDFLVLGGGIMLLMYLVARMLDSA